MQNLEQLHQRISSTHLPALDGLRFVAVFLVIVYHLGFENVPGGNGVMLFFVLSGFLITWLMLKENEATGTISLKAFFKRRVLRIFPAFYAYALLTLVFLVVTGRNVPWAHAISSLLYFSNYFIAFNQDSNNAFSHTWSLAIEEQFYLFFPLLFLLFCRNLKHLKIAIVGLILATWAWRIVLVFGLNASGGYIYSAFDTRLDNLLVGCLLAVILRERSLEWVWKILLRNALMPIATVALLAISIYFSLRSVIYKSTVGFAVEPVLMAILITQMMAFSAAGIWQLLEWKPVKFLGLLSYSLYLYQQLTTSFVAGHMGEYSTIIRITAAVAMTVFAAVASYYLIEMPFLKLKTMSIGQMLRETRLEIIAAFGRRTAN
ncbi:MAG: acyltransferase [Pyrinomonadaceae bacterium]